MSVGAICAWLLASGCGNGGGALLDSSFGTSGIVTLAVGSGHDRIHALALQSDGKIVAVGTAAMTDFDFAIVRLTSAGAVDTTFGGGDGIVTLDMGIDDTAYAVTVASDGSILVAGAVGVSGGTHDFGVARLLSDGTLDSGFSADGTDVKDFGGNADDQARAIGLTSGSNVLLGGWGSSGSGLDFAVTAYDSAGAAVTAFGTAGTGNALVPVGSGEDKAFAMVIQPDGKIALAGSAVAGSSRDFAAVRLKADGTLDSTLFGTSGKATVDLGGDDVAHALQLRSNGRLVLAGVSEQGSDDVAIAQLLGNGTLDGSFGSSGVTVVDPAGDTDAAYGAGLKSDGALRVAGSTDNSMLLAVGVRLTGLLDLGFGSSGVHTLDYSSGIDELRAVAVQPDDKVLVGGFTYNGSNQDFLLMRYAN